MATVSTEFKRLFLRELAWQAEEKNTRLYDALKAVSRTAASSQMSGRSVVQTSSNGHSVTFSTPGLTSEFTPVEACNLCEELITRYEAAKVATGLTDADNSNDVALLTEMMALMEAVTEAYSDFSQMRTVGCGV